MRNQKNNVKIDYSYMIPNFHHVPGVHCTSSAIRNIFEFHGFNMSEAMVFGLGSGLGLGYGKIGSKNPVIGGRQYKFEDNLCKLLNIKLNNFRTTNEEKGWLRLKSMLENNIPAAINVDMTYLPYQDLPEDFHFGQHAIVVAGYNHEKSTVLLSDTHFPELKEISIDDLFTSRNSTYNRWMDPRNLIYEFTFPESIPELKDVIPIAIRKNGKNIQKKSRLMSIFGMTNGIDAVNKFSEGLEMLPTLMKSVLQERCNEIVGFISDYGTGGGLFRYIFSQFLNEAGEICSSELLVELGEFYKSLGDKWEEVSIMITRLPVSPEHEIDQVIRNTMDILHDIQVLELEGARKLQDYSG